MNNASHTIREAPGDATSKSAFYIRAALVIMIAALLRLLFADRYQIWLDEAYCFEMATKNLGGLITALSAGNEPPLHLALLHYWIRAFGEGPVALRSLSAVPSTLTVAALVFWDAPWFSRRSRLLAGFTLAITPIAIYYGQFTRMYSLLVLVVVLSMIFLERGLRRGRTRDWALFSILTALGLYTSYVAIYLVGVGYVAVATMHFSGRYKGIVASRLGALVAAHAAAAVMFSPWLGVFHRQPTGKVLEWIRPFWTHSNKAVLPLHSLSLMTTGGGYYPSYLTNLYQDEERTRKTREAIRVGKETGLLLKVVKLVPPRAPLALSTALAVFLLFMAMRGAAAFPHRWFLAAWLLLAILVPLGISFVRPVFIVGRYEIAAVPAFAILVGIGLARLPFGVRAVCVAIATALFFYTWIYMCSWPAYSNNSQKGAILAGVASSEDVMLCEGFEYSPMYYYAGAKRDRLTFMTVPGDMVEHSAWFDFGRWFEQPDNRTVTPALREEAARCVAESVARTPIGRSLILVQPMSPSPWESALAAAVKDPIDRVVSLGLLRREERGALSDWGITLFRRTNPGEGVGTTGI